MLSMHGNQGGMLLTLDVLCDHNLIVSNSLWHLTLVWMVTWLFQLVLLFMFKYAMFFHVDSFDLLDSNFLILYSNMGVCSQLVYNGIDSQTKKLDICHLRGIGATYPKHVLCWSLCANDSQLIWKFAWHSNATYPKHPPLEFWLDICWWV